jgi:KaiC/GvpD/RAD55 family RecA-like ATPase
MERATSFFNNATVPSHPPESSYQGNSPLDCLFAPSVRFILLKGLPGTGKTTLALELLTMQGQGMYVSTRVSLDLLSRQNVRLRKLIEEGKIFEYYDKSAVKTGEIGFADNRLGTVKEIMQSVLEMAATKRGVADGTNEKLIVIDSWDSIAGIMDPMERKRFEHAFLTMADANKIRLVFVSETNSITDSDYMVDAIVELEDDVFDNRRTRRIVWKKIRGQEIPQRTSLYTLHTGIFTVFAAEGKVPLDYPPREFPAIPHTERMYSTGSKDVDDLLLGGGLPHGTVIALELDSNVRPVRQWPLGLSIVLNFISNGGCSLFLPPLEIPGSNSKKALARHLPEQVLKDSFRMLTDSKSENNDPCFIPLNTESVEKAMSSAFGEIMTMKGAARGRANRPCFTYVSVDAAEKLFGEIDQVAVSRQLVRLVKQQGDVAMLVLNSGSVTSRQAINSADLHLKLIIMDGNPVIYAAKPLSPHFFHFKFDFGGGYPKVRLTPIV